MSQRIDPDTAVTVTVGIRLPTALLELLDAEVDLALAAAPGTQATRASVSRALLATALQERAAARAKPPRVETKARKPAPAEPAPRVETKAKKPTLREAVLAALRAAERPGTDTMSIVVVVRACLVQHPVDAIHTTLRTLDRERVIEMRPDSGYASDFTPADRELCPRSIQPGEWLTAARWLKRPV